ncbi:MAG TPA: hypothetical protein VK588_08515, partial [Chitinophagaceae bacterium]|nr:hypothetical protein [Chitinophagaceae bacterium]
MDLDFLYDVTVIGHMRFTDFILENKGTQFQKSLIEEDLKISPVKLEYLQSNIESVFIMHDYQGLNKSGVHPLEDVTEKIRILGYNSFINHPSTTVDFLVNLIQSNKIYKIRNLLYRASNRKYPTLTTNEQFDCLVNLLFWGGLDAAMIHFYKEKLSVLETALAFPAEEEQQQQPITDFKIIFESVEKFERVIKALISENYINKNTYFWIDRKNGYKSMLIRILKSLRDNGYYKKELNITNQDFVTISKSYFNID